MVFMHIASLHLIISPFMVNLAASRQPQRGKNFPRKAQEEDFHADQFLESDSHN